MNSPIERNSAMGVMAFYADPDLKPHEFALVASQTLHSLGDMGRLHPVILINDGGTLKGEVNIQEVVYTVNPENHLGKAGAVRDGLKTALERNPNAQFIAQADFDRDPNPQQFTRLIRTLHEHGIGGDRPAMVLGERDTALKKKGFMDEHRQAVFALQHEFCQLLGYPQITDPTTGLRVYTRSLAEGFIKYGISNGFGSDVEQLILARLIDAKVFSVKLNQVRRRPTQTSVFKFQACQDALLLHAEALNAEGLGALVDTFGNLSTKDSVLLSSKNEAFRLRSDSEFMKGYKA